MHTSTAQSMIKRDFLRKDSMLTKSSVICLSATKWVLGDLGCREVRLEIFLWHRMKASLDQEAQVQVQSHFSHMMCLSPSLSPLWASVFSTIKQRGWTIYHLQSSFLLECSVSESFIFSKTQFNLPGHSSIFPEFFSAWHYQVSWRQVVKILVPHSPLQQMSITSTASILSFMLFGFHCFPPTLPPLSCHHHAGPGCSCFPTGLFLSVSSGPDCGCHQTELIKRPQNCSLCSKLSVISLKPWPFPPTPPRSSPNPSSVPLN